MNTKEMQMEKEVYQRDRELMDAIVKLQGGDVNAFDMIYLHTNRFMFYKAGQLLASYYNKDSELRNDLVQDAYIKVFNNISSLKEPERFYGWLNTILVNTIYAYTRSHWREEFDVENEEGDSMVDTKSVDSVSPEDMVIDKEKLDYINNALMTLPPLQRYTVEYYYYSELSVEEIADKMECSTGTVKSRLNYARQKLKGVFEEIEKTKRIKLRGIFAIPALLFFAKEEAMAASVDIASFSGVRQALSEYCSQNASLLQGGNMMTQDNNNINRTSTYTGEQITGTEPMAQASHVTQEIARYAESTGQVMAQVSVSIWKTALGKIMIAVMAVLVSAGVITGLYFVFSDDNPKGDVTTQEPVEEVPGDVAPDIDNNEDATIDIGGVDETEDADDSDDPAKDDTGNPETMLVLDENGYWHIGNNSGEGIPSYYLYKENDAMDFYTAVKPTYFVPGETVTINAGYTVFTHWRPEVHGFYSVDLTGAYKVNTWLEGVEIEGISYEEYMNSGAKGIYVDGSSFTVSVPDVDQTTLSGGSYFAVTDSENHIISLKFAEDAQKTFASSSEVKPIDYIEQCYYVFLYAYQNEDVELLQETFDFEEPVYELAIKHFEDEYEGYYEASFSHVIDRDSAEEFYELRRDYKNASSYSGYARDSVRTEDYSQYLFMVGYYFDDEYTNNDEYGVAGKMVTLMNSYETLFKEHFEPLVDTYFEAEDMKARAAVYQQMSTPMTIVAFDKEYIYYPYRAYYSSGSDHCKYIYGYLIPTGNVVEVPESGINVTKPESKEEKEQVVIPEVTLSPVAYYDRETGMSGLKAMDAQVNEVLDVLQMEIDGEVTTVEQGEAIRNILWKTRELYFVICADNGSMKNYSAINSNAWLAPYGLADFKEIIDYYEDKADFKHYVNIYMGTHTGCISGRLQSIKDSLKVISGVELTKTQQVAMKLSKELLDVFYAHRENFEKVIDAYAERAGRTYDENLEYYRELTDYYARMEEITAYWSLIAEVPGWMF